MSKQSNNTFDRDLAPIRLRGQRFPSVFNVIVPINYNSGQVIRPHWLEEPEADAYLGLPYTLSVPVGTRCLWVPRVDTGYFEMIYPLGAPSNEYQLPWPETVRPVDLAQ